MAMMATAYFVLPELSRGRVISPWTGQIAFLIFMAACLLLVRKIDNRASRANSVETPEQIRNRIDILTQQLLAEPEESWKLLHERGILRISEEDWQGAVDDFSKSLEESRTWEPTTRRYRGEALAQLERHEEAIEDLSFAIEHLIENFRPQYPERDREAVGDSLLTRAECHIALNHHDRAAQDLKLAKPFLSGDDLALRSMHLANCHCSSGDVDAAITEARKAIEIYEERKASPRSLESAYTFLGEHLSEAKRHEEAVAAFSHAIDLNRNHAGKNEDLDALLLWRVNVSLQSRHLQVGIRDIEEMLERHPGDKNSRIWRATFNFEAGDYKTAAAEWLDLLQDSPDDETLLVNCIGVLAGDPDDEVRDGRRALELAHRLAALHKDPEWRSQGGLAAAHAELGDFENAIAAAERSLELAPDDEKPGRLHRLEAYRNGRPFRYETIHRSG